MGVDARKAEIKKSDYKGQTYYFCSDLCKRKFDKNPEQYRDQGPGVRGQGSVADSHSKMAKDLACGMDVDINARGVFRAEYQGKIYYFCTSSCRDNFMKDPQKCLEEAQGKELEPQTSRQWLEDRGQGSGIRDLETGFWALNIDRWPWVPDPRFLIHPLAIDPWHLASEMRRRNRA